MNSEDKEILNKSHVRVGTSPVHHCPLSVCFNPGIFSVGNMMSKWVCLFVKQIEECLEGDTLLGQKWDIKCWENIQK